jgi:hypothetical protein
VSSRVKFRAKFRFRARSWDRARIRLKVRIRVRVRECTWRSWGLGVRGKGLCSVA